LVELVELEHVRRDAGEAVIREVPVSNVGRLTGRGQIGALARKLLGKWDVHVLDSARVCDTETEIGQGIHRQVAAVITHRSS